MENAIINNKYKLIKKIGSGSFGTIFECLNIRTQEKNAIKLELIEDELKLLRYECNIYKILDGINNVPKIKWYGKDDKYYYMVLDLLGDSLQTLIDKSGKFKLKIILQIGINILNILNNIHDKGFIHRDVKPENFLLTINKPKKLFIIDFGISKPYLINKQHIKSKITNKFLGTQNFASINSHNFYEQSRRDDLESLAYMLIYFYFGKLPWMDEKQLLNKEEENLYVKNKKIDLINNNDIPNILLNFYKDILSLEFYEKPKYELYINNFKNELEIIL
jgi:serine/threonine protein kinase